MSVVVVWGYICVMILKIWHNCVGYTNKIFERSMETSSDFPFSWRFFDRTIYLEHLNHASTDNGYEYIGNTVKYGIDIILANAWAMSISFAATKCPLSLKMPPKDMEIVFK